MIYITSCMCYAKKFRLKVMLDGAEGEEKVGRKTISSRHEIPLGPLNEGFGCLVGLTLCGNCQVLVARYMKWIA